MRPVHDIDVLILMAAALAAKRRPAELAEIVAAADLLQGSVPFAEKLGEAIQRLTACGLLTASESGFALTPIAQKLMAAQSRKAGTEELISAIRSDLAIYSPKEEYPSVVLTDEQLGAAMRAHKVSRKAAGRNLLMPKPKPDKHFKVGGRWRRASAKR
jgi:hypothetical protein